MTKYMCHLLESIRVEDGNIYHLPYHEQRVRRTQQSLFGEITLAHLADHVIVPEHARQGLYKCRVIYRQTVERVKFVPYQPKPIRTLRRVYCNSINYSHKYEDRRVLNELYAQRGDCDDILIIKDGLVTDTSYANILFYDGQRWVTPADPLLQGTQRQYLLDRGTISEETIYESDMTTFRQFQPINALLSAKHPAQPISNILEK